MSSNLAILFEEGFALLPKLSKQAVESPQDSEKEHYNLVRIVVFREIRQLSGLHPKNLDIGKVSSMLSTRDFSRRGNRSLAIAPLPGIDVRQLVNVDAASRMRGSWRSVRHVPLNILTTGYPKLIEISCWALPSTLIGFQTRCCLEPYKRNAIVTTRRLKGMYWICRLLTPLTLSERSCRALSRVGNTGNLLCMAILR